jgi:predicted nucleotidyltransferase
MQRLAPDEGIKKAVEAKNKYGVTRPLLLAVNLMEDFCEDIDVMNALFGHETVMFSAEGTRPGARLHDGAWDGPHGPQNTSISAVLAFHDLQVWNIKQNRLWIVHNPWSARPLDPAFLPFSQYVPNLEQGTLRRIEGNTTIGEALGLPDPWPPDDPEMESPPLQTLRSSLLPLTSRIAVAFIYGSVARREEDTESDIDLMVVGSASLEEILAQLSDVERGLGKTINPNVYSAAEFKSKLASGNHFLNAVMRSEKVFLIGAEDELRKMAGEHMVEKGTHQPR